MVSAMGAGVISVTAVLGLSVCFTVGNGFFLFFISCEYKLPHPNFNKNYNKTILNKFLCKSLNAIFVKLWLVF